MFKSDDLQKSDDWQKYDLRLMHGPDGTVERRSFSDEKDGRSYPVTIGCFSQDFFLSGTTFFFLNDRLR